MLSKSDLLPDIVSVAPLSAMATKGVSDVGFGDVVFLAVGNCCLDVFVCVVVVLFLVLRSYSLVMQYF